MNWNNLINWIGTLAILTTGYWYWEYNQYQNNLFDNVNDVIIILPYTKITNIAEDGNLLRFDYNINQSEFAKFGNYQYITITLDGNQQVMIIKYENQQSTYYETINLDVENRQFLLLEKERKQLLDKLLLTVLIKLEKEL